MEIPKNITPLKGVIVGDKKIELERLDGIHPELGELAMSADQDVIPGKWHWGEDKPQLNDCFVGFRDGWATVEEMNCHIKILEDEKGFQEKLAKKPEHHCDENHAEKAEKLGLTIEAYQEALKKLQSE